MKEPWLNEPDHVDFEHAGYPCILHRGPMGQWCGYVGVPPGHPAHGAHYGSVDVDVHGGLTYANACQGDICHVAKPGEPDDVWWLGFDCAHWRDMCPREVGLFRKIPGYPKPERGKTYRDLSFVTRETQELAEQLRAMHV